MTERLNRTQKATLQSRGTRVANSVQYEIPTWNQIYDMILTQAEKIQGYKPDLIVGIARGGLIPARILTDMLETPLLATIEVEFYLGIAQTKAEPTLKQPLTTPVKCKKILIVDDIADTGKTLQLAKSWAIRNKDCYPIP
jgi:hypoxanthine phosphoribosyltransferase